jgi:hypothetical protein
MAEMSPSLQAIGICFAIGVQAHFGHKVYLPQVFSQGCQIDRKNNLRADKYHDEYR